MAKRKFEAGQKYGRLTIMKPYLCEGAPYKWYHLCACDCGKEKAIQGSCLKTGKVTSCGCYRLESLAARATHGMEGTRTYKAWCDIKQRCHNPKNPSYPDYGGSGVFVCAEWLSSFEQFFTDMGRCPAGLTIDRIDGGKGYQKGNCRWATRKTQAENRGPHQGRENKGVYQVKSGRYVAAIGHNYKVHWLGTFAEESEAIAARKSAELRLWGQ